MKPPHPAKESGASRSGHSSRGRPCPVHHLQGSGFDPEQPFYVFHNSLGSVFPPDNLAYRLGCNTQIAPNGREAMPLFPQEAFDIMAV